MRNCQLSTYPFDAHVQAEDRSKFSQEWTKLALADVSAESRMRRGAHELAERHPAKPRQLTQIESVDQLMEQAQAAEEPLHQAMSAFVETLGGHYDRGVSKDAIPAHYRQLQPFPHHPLVPTSP